MVPSGSRPAAAMAPSIGSGSFLKISSSSAVEKSGVICEMYDLGRRISFLQRVSSAFERHCLKSCPLAVSKCLSKEAWESLCVCLTGTVPPSVRDAGGIVKLTALSSPDPRRCRVWEERFRSWRRIGLSVRFSLKVRTPSRGTPGGGVG